MLLATDLSVRLNRRTILDRIDLAARPGEVTCIVGPNGSGKTTLMRALTGEVPYTGTITLNDQDLARTPPAQLAGLRGVLPQSTPLAFPFTVLEVVRIGLTAGLTALDAPEDLPLQALAAVGLEGHAGRFFQSLSGGEQQRAQLARVLVQVWQPVKNGMSRWLFLDEPVSSLDIAHQLAVMEIARNYAARGGGVVAVMHDLNLTAMVAQSVAILNSGALLRQGSPQEVLTDTVISEAYGCRMRVNTVPEPGRLFVLPQVAGLPERAL